MALVVQFPPAGPDVVAVIMVEVEVAALLVVVTVAVDFIEVVEGHVKECSLLDCCCCCW